MTKKRTQLNLIIIDASGSMQPKTQEVKNGLIELFQEIGKQTELKQRTVVCSFAGPGTYTVLFDGDDTPPASIAEKYIAHGATALYDAICTTFNAVKGKKKFDGGFVSVLTDGEENSSREFGLEQVQEIIKRARKRNWLVQFMGTTEAALKQAHTMGVAKGSTLHYADTGEGTLTAAANRSASMSMYSSANSSDTLKSVDVDNITANAEKVVKEAKETA